MTTKNTFNALKAHGDFNAAPIPETPKDTRPEDTDAESADPPQKKRKGGFEPEFHYNIQVQLPANGTEETYMNIFSALRKVFPS